MMRLLVFLSCVGAAIYALLVVTNNKMPVVPDGTKAEFVARETRLRVWGPSLPSRPLRWLATTPQFGPPQQKIALTENAAVRSPPAIPNQAVTSSSQIGERLASFEARLPASDHDPIWFVVSRAARLHDGPSVSSPIVHLYPVGTELRSIGYQQGWFRVLDPTTSRTGWIYQRYYLQVIPGPGQTRTHSTRLTSHTRGLGGVRTEAGRSHQEPKAQTKVREAKARKAHTPGKCAGRRERRQHHGESIWEKLTTRPNLPAMPRQNRGAAKLSGNGRFHLG